MQTINEVVLELTKLLSKGVIQASRPRDKVVATVNNKFIGCRILGFIACFDIGLS